MALASLHESWTKRGLAYLIDGLWLPDVAYADDVVLLAMSTAALHIMLPEVEDAFAAVGLAVNLDKTNFTSTLACEGKSLELSGHVVKWPPRLTFLGTVITLCGNDDEAIRARVLCVRFKYGHRCSRTKRFLLQRAWQLCRLSPVFILLASTELDTD